jgi:hypothetical protein
VDRSLRDRAFGVGVLGMITALLGLLSLAFPEHSALRELLAMVAATLGVFFLPLGVFITVAEVLFPERE